MKIICQQSDLISALNAAGRAAAPRSTKQILECVHVRAKTGILTLTCTDLQMGIEVAIPAQVKDEGQFLLPVRLLTEIVRKLPDEEMTIDVRENYSAVIRSHGSRTTIQGLNADEFPKLPEIEDSKTVLVGQKLLRDMIRQTVFAVAVEESRPILMGCLVQTEGDRISVVALDGFRLAVRKGALAAQAAAISAVVPGKYMSEIVRLLSDDEGEIAVGFGKTHMSIDLASVRVLVRLMDGEYVQYQKLIPQENKMTALVGVSEFTDCVDRASLMAREGKSNLVRFHFEDGTMQITSNSEMGDVFEEMGIEWQGEDLDIAFNVRYTSDVLRNIDEEKMLMRFNTPVSPCVIVPEEGDSFLYLLLPVRIYTN